MNRIMCFLTLFVFASDSLAHTRWLLPSHTDLSGQDPHAVSFDVSISNELYHADFSLYYEEEWKIPTFVNVAFPDGSTGKSEQLVHLPKRSIFSSMLDQDGSYRFELLPRDLFFRDYQVPGEDGVFRAWEEVPEQGVNVKEVTYRSRLSTYISRNSLTDIVPTKKGLELSGDHPNDLVSGESSKLQILLDGKSVKAGIKVRIIPGGTRYRNERNEMDFLTDDAGSFLVSWPQAGMYLLEVEHDVEQGGNKLIRHATYVTLEVMPY